VYLVAMLAASMSRDSIWLMLAVVALFPVVLLALLLITSGLEGRVVRQPTPKVGAGERPGTRGQG
jgi:hypothetical protein